MKYFLWCSVCLTLLAWLFWDTRWSRQQRAKVHFMPSGWTGGAGGSWSFQIREKSGKLIDWLPRSTGEVVYTYSAIQTDAKTPMITYAPVGKTTLWGS